MYRELTDQFLAAPGIRREDNVIEYANSFPHLDISSLDFQEGVTKILDDLVGPQAIWEIVPKGVHTGDSDDAIVIKVKQARHVYYLKFTTCLRVQLGMLFSYAYYHDHPQPFASTAAVLFHGTVTLKGGQNQYLMLIEEAKGVDLFGAFETRDQKIIFSYVETAAKALAYNHFSYVSKALPADKSRFASKKTTSILKKALPLHKKSIPDCPLKTPLQTVMNTLLESHQSYLNTPQVSSLYLGSAKVWNLSFSDIQHKITFFDPPTFYKYCGPSQPPLWAPEMSFIKFLHSLDFLERRYNFHASEIEKIQDHFLQTYYLNSPRLIMSPQGLKLYETQAFLESIRKAINRVPKKEGSYENALQKISQFREFAKPNSPRMQKLMGY